MDLLSALPDQSIQQNHNWPVLYFELQVPSQLGLITSVWKDIQSFYVNTSNYMRGLSSCGVWNPWRIPKPHFTDSGEQLRNKNVGGPGEGTLQVRALAALQRT